MGKERDTKWHEDIFTGLISASIGITLFFNGFSYLTTWILSEDGIEGGPTKQKALVVFFSTLEGGWWKYLFVLIFLALAFVQVRNGIQKHPGNK